MPSVPDNVALNCSVFAPSPSNVVPARVFAPFAKPAICSVVPACALNAFPGPLDCSVPKLLRTDSVPAWASTSPCS